MGKSSRQNTENNMDKNIDNPFKKGSRTSRPQEAFYYYIKQIYQDAINCDKVGGKEVDIHIPSLNIGIEYDGEYAHSGEVAREREERKNKILKELGLRLIRVKEVKGNSSKIHISNVDGIQIFTYSNYKYKHLDKVIVEVITSIFGDCPINVDWKTDNIKILESCQQVAFEKSLEKKYPEIAKQWHPTENGNLRPSGVSPGSVNEVWWQCEKYPDHKWKTAVYSRVAGNGCPICAGKTVLTGFNDLETQYPELSKEWHPTKNGDRKPSEVTPGCNDKVWWKCKVCGHEWEATINDRKRGTGCPSCAGKEVLVGFNDLETQYPELSKEWHPTKNGDRKPSEVTPGCNDKVWWRCKVCGFEWETEVYSRALNGNGCPVCAGKTVLAGFNDLETQYPELSKEWHPTKNGDRKPSEVTPGCNDKVWWRCKVCGYEWETEVYSRALNGRGCSVCVGQQVLAGVNDLETQYPELSKEWHPTKNGDRKPSEVTPGCKDKVWWRCEKGHEWEARIYSRVAGRGCPYCAGKKVLEGFNDLQTKYPELAKEWNPTKNGDLKPSEATPGSDKKVWWKCKMCGYEWEARISSRKSGNGCPECAKLKRKNKSKK